MGLKVSRKQPPKGDLISGGGEEVPGIGLKHPVS